MSLSKHLIPSAIKQGAVELIDEHLPEGIIRNNLANIETVSGLVLVAAGKKVDGKVGLVLRAAGQLMDDIDGDTARTLDIESRLGTLLDPILDKFKMYLEVKTLWDHSAEFEDGEKFKRRLALGTIASKHITNGALNVTSFLLGLDPASSAVGKINLWIDGVAIEAFGISDVIDDPHRSEQFANLGYIATVAGLPTGILTATGYGTDLIHGIQAKFS